MSGKKKKGGSAKKAARKKSAASAAEAAETAAAAAAKQHRDANLPALDALKRLMAALSDLDETGGGAHGGGSSLSSSSTGVKRAGAAEAEGGPKLSHWRTLTPDVVSAYKMMDDGSSLVRATSTKYTLVGKVDHDEGAKMSSELRQGCELLASGVLVIFNPSEGCSRSTKHFARMSARAVVATTINLVQSFVDMTALNENVGARLTGAVWSACDGVQKMPRGNRACARRELLSWCGECNETMEEFEELLELGPAAGSWLDAVQEEDEGTASASLDRQGSALSSGSAGWKDFCDQAGTGEQYSATEIPLVRACLGLVKCSRGTIKTALEACEHIGSAVEKEDAAAGTAADTAKAEGGADANANAEEEDKEEVEQRKKTKREKLRHIGRLVELARAVGDGMTELGTLLYPPLNVSEENSELEERIESQRAAIVALHNCVLGKSGGKCRDGEDGKEEVGGDEVAVVLASEEIAEHATKIRAGAGKRAAEALEALSDARSQTRQ